MELLLMNPYKYICCQLTTVKQVFVTITGTTTTTGDVTGKQNYASWISISNYSLWEQKDQSLIYRLKLTFRKRSARSVWPILVARFKKSRGRVHQQTEDTPSHSPVLVLPVPHSPAWINISVLRTLLPKRIRHT